MPLEARDKKWFLFTQKTAYVIGLNRAGRLVNCYWGARLPVLDDYPDAETSTEWASFDPFGNRIPEEFPVYGAEDHVEPCLKVTFADGVRGLALHFVMATLDGETLILRFQDDYYPFAVNLCYKVHDACDLIERWASVENLGEQNIQIERIFSAQWHVPNNGPYRLTHLTGRWAAENTIRREWLTNGIKVLDSRRLNTSHHHSPYFALDFGNTDEDHGAVWFGALSWSGNWKIAAETNDFSAVRLSIGINDWDFGWTLQAGETLTTPPAIGGYTLHGFGGASRHLHDYIRDELLPHGKAIHPILYNSWEATLFDVDENSQGQLAEIAAKLGIELFVMDDGWFHGRKTDRAGLGDWWPDANKFPQGLKPLIDRVNAFGMAFGLWVEPEMVNPDSDLYRGHPDWVIHFPHRARSERRNQLILNFGRADVRAYIIGQLDKLLSENAIRFIKWDMNRSVSEPGWPEHDQDQRDQRELWVRHVWGVYEVWGALRHKHPEVVFQSCSGGGGRADLGILRYADQIWVSDNTEATARLGIQAGFSQIFPANTMEAWVTDADRARVPLEFRFHVSMCGSLGIGGHLLHWSEADRTIAARCIALYKSIRPIVQLGDMYRLRSPQETAFSAVQYMSKDRSEGVLFAFRTHIPDPVFLPHIYLQGLDPDARYTIDEVPGIRSGAGWMASGVWFDLHNFESTVRRIRRMS
jgi:alpha-galactosidase